MNKKIVLPLFLIAGLVASVATQGFTQMSVLGGGTKQAKSVATDFIDKTFMGGQGGFEITDVVRQNGLYKLTVDVQGQEIVSYMTQDFSRFFPSVVDMNPEEKEDEASAQQQQQEEIPQKDNPEVMLFTQSFCPYGNQAETLMAPVVDLLGESVEVKPHYIFYENYGGGGPDYCVDEESKYCSMHGIGELNQDVRELCVYNNQNDKYWDFVNQVNQDCTASDVDECWEDSANKVSVDVNSVKSCFDSKTMDYVAQEKNLTDELEVSASPTILINGVRYSGDRTSEAFKQAICSGFKNQPEACEQTLDDSSSSAEGNCG